MTTGTLERPTMALPETAPMLLPERPEAPVHARPIAVAAYPASQPRWVTYAGRRNRVVAVHQQPALDSRLDPIPFGMRRLAVELADGRVLTLLHDGGGWYAGDQ